MYIYDCEYIYIYMISKLKHQIPSLLINALEVLGNSISQKNKRHRYWKRDQKCCFPQIQFSTQKF